jgi:hypothetical protein
MSQRVNIIKNAVKKGCDCEKPSFGKDPNDPWSVKSNVTEETLEETALLNRYLKSRGINPEFVTKDQKVSHSKTNQFRQWMRDHMNESMSQEHTPTEKRLHALKKAIHYHQEIRVAGDGHKKLHGEETEQIDEISAELQTRYYKAAERSKSSAEGAAAYHRRALDTKGAAEHEKTAQKREKGINRYTQRYNERNPRPKVTQTNHLTDKYPLGGRDEKSGRSYSESLEFNEGVDKKDTVTMDIPLLIRVLELAREDLKSDMDLHRVVEKIINIRNKGTLTMDDYDTVAQIKEEWEQLDELQKSTLMSYASKAREQGEKLASQGTKAKKLTTQYDKFKKAAKRVSGASKAERKVAVKDIMGEDTYHDSMAATQMPFDMGNSPAEEPTTAKRIVKDLVRNKRGIKEELYDHEKEDKSVASYGKKPKVQNLEPDGTTKESPQAAAVLTGGKTLTGTPRDTIEIDPMMKTKKQATFGSQKPIK